METKKAMSKCKESPQGYHVFKDGNKCIFCGFHTITVTPLTDPKPLKGLQFDQVVIEEIKPVKGIHSELHEMVATLRREFGETNTKGPGSFGYYLKMLKQVPMQEMWIWLGNIRDSPKLDTPLAKCKVFWWKYKMWKKGK